MTEPRPALWAPLRHRRFAAYALAVVISSSGTYAATARSASASWKPPARRPRAHPAEPRAPHRRAGAARRGGRRPGLAPDAAGHLLRRPGGQPAGGRGDPGGGWCQPRRADGLRGGQRRRRGVSRPATVGLLPELVPAAELQPANAVLGMAPRIIAMAGAAAGAALVDAVGAGWALVYDSGTFVLAAVLFGCLGRTAGRRRRRGCTRCAPSPRAGPWCAGRPGSGP